MDGREKVLSCLDFDKGSRSVKAEFAFWYETLDRWYKEGLPKDEGLPEYAVGHNIRSNFNTNFLNEKMVDNEVCRYFDFDFKSHSILNDGDMTSLIPLLLKSGVNGLLPFEVTGTMDLVKIRKDHPELKIAGGINKMKLFGDKDEIDKELEKVPHMLKKGGYVPFVDHSVPPPLVSWDNFVYYREKLNDIIFQNPME